MSIIEQATDLVSKQYPFRRKTLIQEAAETIYDINEGFDGEADAEYLAERVVDFFLRFPDLTQVKAKIAEYKRVYLGE